MQRRESSILLRGCIGEIHRSATLPDRQTQFNRVTDPPKTAGERRWRRRRRRREEKAKSGDRIRFSRPPGQGGSDTMQAAAPSWMVMKTLPVLRTRLAAASSFHSTPLSSEKWKNKWDCPKSEKGARKASRKYERYVVRQKRAEGKKALKDYLLYGKSSPNLQDGSTCSFANSHHFPRFKTFRKGHHPHWSSRSHQGVHNQRKKKKGDARFSHFFHDDHYVHPDDLFEAIFGAHHGFTWSHRSWEGFRFRDKSFRFRWAGESNKKQIPSDSEDESEDDTRETTSVGSHAHRSILGLPSRGPLTLDDVKTAFRACALRWHPDRHPGSSQGVAEEKFKLCVNAYNSLCSVLKAAS